MSVTGLRWRTDTVAAGVLLAGVAAWMGPAGLFSDARASFAVLSEYLIPFWAAKRLFLVAARLLALALGLWATGAAIEAWISGRGAGAPVRTVRLALGTGAFGTVLFALSLLGLSSRPTGILVFCLLAVPAIVEAIKAEPRLIAGLEMLRRKGVPRPGWRTALTWAAVAAPCAILLVVLAGDLMVPENFFDALTYHLSWPRRLLAEGRLPGPPPVFFGFPGLVPGLYSGLLPLGGEFLVRAFSAAMLVSCGLALADAGKSLGAERGGRFAALAFVTTPIVLLLGAHAGTDMATAWFSILAVACFVRAFPGWPAAGRTRGSPVLLAGVSAGLATAAKYQGAAGFLLLAAFIAVLGTGIRHKARLAGLLLAGWVAAYGAYAVHGWLARGDPVYPFGAGAFGAAATSVAAQESYSEELTVVTGREYPAAARGAGFAAHLVRYKAGLFGPLLLAGIVFVWSARAGTLPLAYAAGFLSLWALSVPVFRYALPGWGMFLLAVFAPLSGERRLIAGRALVGLHLLAACVWFPQAVHLVDGPIPFLRGGESVVDYYARMQSNSPGHARAFFETMELGGPRRRVLCVGESRGYLCGDWALSQSRFEPAILSRLARKSRDGDELAKRLRQMGVGHVLVNEGSLMSLRVWHQAGMDPAPVAVLRDLFARRLRLVYMRNWVSVHELVPAGTVGSRLPEAFEMQPGTGAANLLKGYDLGQVRLAAGDGAGAVKAGWFLVGDHPQSGLAWSHLGNALMAAGRTKEAVGAYQQAVRFGARNAGLYLNMGRAFAAERLYGRAQYAYELAARFDPVTPETSGAIDELKATVMRDVRRRSR